MLSRTLRLTVGASLVALFAMTFAPHAFAQKGGDGVLNNEVTWPTSFTLGFGAAANDNWQGSGTMSTMPTGGPSTDLLPNAVDAGTYGYNQSHGIVQPEFHILAEIPIATNLMFAPRVAYNDYSLRWDAQNSPSAPATGNQPLVISQAEIGADLLFKYAFSNLHVMAGANLSTPIHDMWFAHTQNVSDAVDHTMVGSGTVPNFAKFVAALKGGIGYDIPLNAKNTIWLTPEAFFTYPVTDYVQDPNPPSNNRELFPVTLTGGASLKFALSGPPEAAPPPLALNASITAHGVGPNGDITAEPQLPQQTMRTRSSIPVLPYIFFDDNSAVINARYNKSGATGFSETSAMAGKDALAANHALLDIVGERLKNNPSWTAKITGCNANAKDEKNNIGLSKSRASSVADYLKSTWGIDGSRITVDQRNLPELPTNPVTMAGMQENRRAEISGPADLTAPIKIETNQPLAVGAATVRYDMSVTPDPATHAYSSWTVTLDKDGVQIGSPLSGTGAPPASTTADIPGADKYVNQPVHYTLRVTDAAGATATADGYTRIVPKTVSRDNLEKFAMLSFDFDRADINSRARQMLQLISESVSRDATGVQIDGYCDQTGTAEYNQTLSEARANAAVTALRSMTTLPANVTVHGHGFRDLRFDNNLPEGRQLDRRVEFTIEKSSQ